MIPTYRTEAAQIARQHGIPEDLFLALVNQESRWNPNARSPVGAIGLAQLMPGTAGDLGVDPTDPMQNLTGGARYLRQQFDKYGKWDLALAAYNAGPGNVDKHGGIPPFKETQNYVTTIMGNWNSGAEVAADAMIALGHPDRARSGGNTTPAYGPATGAPWSPEAAQATLSTSNPTPAAPNMAGLFAFLNQTGEEERPSWIEQKTGGRVNADMLDTLTIGLEGMTLNPNQTLMQAAAADKAQRKTDRKDKETRNRTAAWLAAQGREDLAALLASGSLSGSDAVKLALTPPEDNRTALVQNYEYAKANGYGGSFTEFLRDQGGSSTSIGTIPPGYQLVQDRGPNGQPITRMEAIPGGPAAVEQQTLEEKEALAAEGTAAQADTVLSAIKTIRDKEASGGLAVTGGWGKLGTYLPGSDAYAVKGLLNTIHSSIAFDKLQAMRAASPTGGALGAVSEKELALLQSSLANLDQFQSGPDFLRELNKVETAYREIMRKAAAYPNAAQYLGNIGSEFVPGGAGAGGGTNSGTSGGIRWSF